MSLRIANSLWKSSGIARRAVLAGRSGVNYQSRMNLLTITNSIKESFVKHELYPDVISDKDFSPKGLLIISYGKDKDVVLGNNLKVDETQELPKVAFTLNVNGSNDLKISSKDNFSLVLTDPDAPTRTDKKWSEYCHYIVSNLKLNPVSASDLGNDVESLTTDLEFEKGDTLIPYQGPGPPPKTGKHRYCFMLFKQSPSVSPEAPSDRPNWGTGIPANGVKEWAAKYQLELLAVNFFFAQNTEQ